MAEEKRRKRTAVALSYEPTEGAPKIVASGEGNIAEKIIEKGQESNVPLYEDSKLARTLLKLDIGDYIPEELYGVVAEILVYVDDMDRIKGKLGGRR